MQPQDPNDGWRPQQPQNNETTGPYSQPGQPQQQYPPQEQPQQPYQQAGYPPALEPLPPLETYGSQGHGPEYPQQQMQPEQLPGRDRRTGIIGALLVTLTIVLTTLAPLFAMGLILNRFKSLQDGFGPLVVIMYFGIPAFLVALIIGFIVARNILRGRGWVSPGFTVIAAAALGNIVTQVGVVTLPVAAAVAGLMTTFGVTLLLRYAGFAHKWGVAGIAVVAVAAMFYITPELTKVEDNKKSTATVSEADFDVWLPVDPQLKYAPTEVDDYEKGVLKFDSPGNLEIYESKAKELYGDPECGMLYHPGGESYGTDGPCTVIGTLDIGPEVFADEDAQLYVNLDGTLVVLRPVYQFGNPGVAEELFDYLNTFKKTDTAGATTLVKESKERLDDVLAKQHDLIAFTPLMPSPVPSGYERTDFTIQGLRDPEQPILVMDYVTAGPARTTGLTMEVGPHTDRFNPPSSCGGLYNDYDEKVTCSQTGTHNGWPVYTSQVFPQTGTYYSYYETDKTFVVARISKGAGIGDTFIKSLKPATKTQIKDAKTLNY